MKITTVSQLYQECVRLKPTYPKEGEIGQVLRSTITMIENHSPESVMGDEDQDASISNSPQGIPEWVEEQLGTLRSRIDDLEERCNTIQFGSDED